MDWTSESDLPAGHNEKVNASDLGALGTVQ